MAINNNLSELKIRSLNLNLRVDKDDLVKYAVQNFRTQYRKAERKYWKLDREYYSRHKALNNRAVQELKTLFMAMFQEVIQECEKLLGPQKSVEFHNSAGWDLHTLVWYYKGYTLLQNTGCRVSMYGIFQKPENSKPSRVETTWVKIPEHMLNKIREVLDQLESDKCESKSLFEKEIDKDPWVKYFSKAKSLTDEEDEFKDRVRAKLATFSLSRLTGDEAESLRQLLLGTDPIPETHPALCDPSHT